MATQSRERSPIAVAAASRDAPGKVVEVRDRLRYPGLLLRIEKSGAKSFYVALGRGKRQRIGPAGAFTLQQAWERATEILRDPDAALAKKAAPHGDGATLNEFMTRVYQPHIAVRLKSADDTIGRIRASFANLLDRRLTSLTSQEVDRRRTQRLQAGRSASTINRDTAALSGLLAHWSETTGHPHPLRSLKALAQADDKRVRHLSPDEEQRLRQALADRDAAGIAERERFIKWCRERGQVAPPPLERFDGHLTPLTLIALGTGLRRGELFGLQWESVDFAKRQIRVTASTSKVNKGRVIPMGKEVHELLTAIKPAGAAKGLVFASPVSGERMVTIKKAWGGVVEAAALTDFRFHDLRHSFASKLAMAGIDLNTIRELLGHSDLKMTLRYSHLQPDHLASAVAVLDR